MQSISYYVRNVYGVPAMYISDPETAQAFTAITGKKTLSPDSKKAFEKLGIEFEQVFDPLNR